ncbi:MAG: PIN domain-containing protein [Magnetococcus sp. DMHC-1]|nr:PIN domain-containing protein [Magnetococcales bacterium]
MSDTSQDYGQDYLLDTNIVSELTKRKPDEAVSRFFMGLRITNISVITLTEIQSGIAKDTAQGKNVKDLSAWFSHLQAVSVIHDVTKDIAIQAGQWRGELMARGRSRGLADIVIGATAFVKDMTLATRNDKDFSEMAVCGLDICNPFTSQSGS